MIVLFKTSHGMAVIHPLDRCIFGDSKHLYKNKQSAGLTPIETEIEKDVIGILLGDAWKRASSASNAVSAFKATEIIPVHQNAIPFICVQFLKRCHIDTEELFDWKFIFRFWQLYQLPSQAHLQNCEK
jgi:hypothetical protein